MPWSLTSYLDSQPDITGEITKVLEWYFLMEAELCRQRLLWSSVESWLVVTVTWSGEVGEWGLEGTAGVSWLEPKKVGSDYGKMGIETLSSEINTPFTCL